MRATKRARGPYGAERLHENIAAHRSNADRAPMQHDGAPTHKQLNHHVPHNTPRDTIRKANRENHSPHQPPKEADFPRASPATDTASPNGQPKETTQAVDRALGISSMAPISSIPGRHEAANNDATSPPATKTKTQAQHKMHEGTSDIPNNEAGTPANTNPYAPPYADTASVDVAEASEEASRRET